MQKTHISVSQLKTFTQCPFKWYYGYKEKLRLTPDRKSQALHMGSWWDAFVESHYNPNVNLTEFEGYLKDENKAKLYALANVSERYVDWKAMPRVCQYEVTIPISGSNRYDRVKGLIDGWDADTSNMYEVKLSTMAETYIRHETIELQVGSYFMGLPEAMRCILQATQVPNFRMSAVDKDSYVNYQARMEKAIASELGKYFLIYDFDTQTYGRMFWRQDFKLERVQTQIENVVKFVDFCEANNVYYANTEGCNMFSGCDYFEICRKGIYNYEIFEIKED